MFRLKLIYIFLLPILFVFLFSNTSSIAINVDDDQKTETEQLSNNKIENKKILNYTPVVNEKEIGCLAKNMYFEAAVESTAGKLAVAHVTYNRVKSDSFPNNFCEVVMQGRHYNSGKPVRHKCQFSWYCDGKTDDPYNGEIWKDTKELATWFYIKKDNLVDITDGALFYHADYIKRPFWVKYKKKTVKIDKHIFYAKL